jgi:hypothetical protein
MKKSLNLIQVAPIKNEPNRFCWDYNISGQSLTEYLRLSSTEAVTPLGWFSNKEVQSKALRQLRLQEKSPLVDGRVEIYVCAECGDIGCGSITVIIEDQGDKIIWRDFADQSDPEFVGKIYKTDHIEFDRQNYFRAFAIIR